MKKPVPTANAVLAAAMRDERISKSCLALLVFVAEMRAAKMTRATQPEIGQALGRSIPWVRHTAAHLVAAGYLTVARRHRNREATYGLKLPTKAELAYSGCSVWSDAKLTREPAEPAKPSRTVADALADMQTNVDRLSASMRGNLALLDRLIARRAA